MFSNYKLFDYCCIVFKVNYSPECYAILNVLTAATWPGQMCGTINQIRDVKMGKYYKPSTTILQPKDEANGAQP